MEELKKLRILRGRDIMNVLSALPKDLDATYDRILASIDSSLAYEASSALQWLACASRPLFLEELAEACIIRPKGSTPLEEDQRLNPMDVLEVLPGLTKVEPSHISSMDFRPQKYIISLAHFSVKEYLFSQRILTGSARSYKISSDLAQQHIAHSCLAYIAYCKSVPRESPHVESQHPLRLYAHSRWALHATLVPGNLLDDICSVAIDLFKEPQPSLDWCAYSNLSRLSIEENKPRWLSIPFGWYQIPRWPIYYLFCHAVLVGNETLVEHLLEIGLQVEADRALGYALKLAAQNGRYSIAQRLLAVGADDTGALIAALGAGQEPIVISSFGIRNSRQQVRSSPCCRALLRTSCVITFIKSTQLEVSLHPRGH